MIGKIITALAGRSVARSIGGASAGPAGAIIGAAIPVVIPTIARRLGPLGMIVAAVGGVLVTRWMDKRKNGTQPKATFPVPRRPAAGAPILSDAVAAPTPVPGLSREATAARTSPAR